MPDTDPRDTTLLSRLDAWAHAERATLAEPAPAFLRAVCQAQPPRPNLLARRLTTLLAAAAAIALATTVALRTPAPKANTTDPRALIPIAATPAPARFITVGSMRSPSIADILDTLDLFDAAPRPAPPAQPTRAADAYCAGCIDELTKL